jgi:hypothetical protein
MPGVGTYTTRQAEEAMLLVFGCSVTKPDVFRSCAARGIERAGEADSIIDARPAAGSIFASYNALLDRHADREGLEALVLVHQDADVGCVGCVGAVGVRSIAWWEASVTCASFVNRYEEHGAGDLPSFSWTWEEAPAYARLGEVETLDGFVLVLSPWAVRSVRFDESLGSFHGYDLDFCLQVRAAGHKVLTADFRAVHHRPLEMVPDPEEWIEAHVNVATKWDGRMGIGAGAGTWQERALRAEADADAALLLGHMHELDLRARQRELELALAETTESLSWRATAPVRRLAAAVSRT